MEKKGNRINNNNAWNNTEFDEKTIELLKYRGFHAKYPNILDDVFYQNRESRAHSFLQSRMSINDIINLDYQKLKDELFKKDSVYPQEVCFINREINWKESFGGTYVFYEVRPDCLDPYIARYVRAINRCGIKTFYSCDGWHNSPIKSKEVVILFDDRYSCIWHQLLCQDRHITVECGWEHDPDSSGGVAKIQLPATDQGKQEIYNMINMMAEEFEKNSEFFQMLKLWVRDHIDSFIIDYLLEQDLMETLKRSIEDLYARLGSFRILN